MSKFRSRLARYNTNCCEQVMPVPVISVCAISCCLPRPICEYKEPSCSPSQPPQPPSGCSPSEEALQNAQLEAHIISQGPLKIPNYNPLLPPPPTGSILTNTTGLTPTGFLLCDGSEVSRTVYSDLYGVIGTYYGTGDNSTTFNLPNLTPETSYAVIYIIKT